MASRRVLSSRSPPALIFPINSLHTILCDQCRTISLDAAISRYPFFRRRNPVHDAPNVCNNIFPLTYHHLQVPHAVSDCNRLVSTFLSDILAVQRRP
jgi:hypothetical protein